MKKKVIYKKEDGSVCILIPTHEALEFATIDQIAEKDVPKNLPYWIVEESYIPKDREFRGAWRIDDELGSPKGFGGKSNKFHADLLAKYKNNKV